MRYLLPALSGSLVRAPAADGWSVVGSLADLARDLRIDGGQPEAAALKSVPDAWAPVRAWRQALLDPRHQLHARTVARWRALLALVALQPTFSRQYALDARVVDLGAGGNRAWRGVLDRLRPNGGLLADADWGRPVLLRVTPVGAPAVDAALLTPDTLLAAGHAAERLRVPGVAFAAEGLSDPLAAGLSATQLRILADHARELIDALKAAGANGDAWTGVAGALEDWRRDLEAALGRRGEPVHATRAARTLPGLAGVHAPLGDTAVLDAGRFAAGYSETALRTRAAAGLGGVALADPELARTLGRPETAVHVYREHTLADCRRDFTSVRLAASRDGWLVVRPDELWAGVLALTEGAPVAKHSASCPGPLPVSALALLLATPDELRAGVSVTQAGGGFAAEWTVRLADGSGHRVARTYAAADTVRARLDPSMALWPDFEAEDWPHDFFQGVENPTSGDLSPQAVVSARLLAADVGGARERPERALAWADGSALRAFAAGAVGALGPDGAPWLTRVRYEQAADARGELMRASLGAEAIAVAATRGGRAIACGLLLCDRPPAPVTRDAEAVAIDFGTSNSIAYRGGADAKREVALKARLVPVAQVSAADRPAWARDNYQALVDFFGGDDAAMPFPTILKRRASAPAEARDLLRAEDGLFLQPPGGFEAAPLRAWVNSRLLAANIKWGTRVAADGAAANVQAEHFLTDLALRIAAELRADGIAPGAIDWAFSYPQAFTPKERELFEALVRRAAGVVGGRERVALRTEAEAAIGYFRDDPQTRLVGVSQLLVMLDIGGGTTDIAVRDGDAPVWRGSVRLAGGQFFTAWLAANAGALRGLGVFDDDPTAGVPADEDHAAERRLLIELAVNERGFGERLRTAIERFAGSDARLEALRAAATTALGGLLWYAGRVLGAQVAAGRLDPAALEQPTLALAGRGATYFRYLTRDDQGRVGRMLLAGAGRTGEAPPVFSKEPKHEVARGLLGEASPRAGEADTALPLGLGVTLSLGAGEAPADAPVSQVMGAKIANVSMADFDLFLAALRQHTGIGITLGGDGVLRGGASIQAAARQALQRAADSGEGAEPPFVVALAALVGMLALPVDARGANVRVTL